MSLSGKRVLIFVGDDYEDLELWYPKLRLIEAGVHVVVAGQQADKVYRGKNGYPCKSDAAINDMESADFDGVLCPGGWIPISANVYRGVKVTGSPGIKDDLINAGGLFEDVSVVIDRHHVTSRKPDDLPDFCKGIFEVVAE